MSAEKKYVWVLSEKINGRLFLYSILPTRALARAEKYGKWENARISKLDVQKLVSFVWDNLID